jgi:hypothetical protein
MTLGSSGDEAWSFFNGFRPNKVVFSRAAVLTVRRG